MSFRNPHGYLPGQQYGLLPFYGILFVLYCCLVIVFAVQLVRHREYSLQLQYAILGIGTIGVVETAAWFFMYLSKNTTGIPTPCVDVCPTTADFLAAVVLSVLKVSSLCSDRRHVTPVRSTETTLHMPRADYHCCSERDRAAVY